MLKIRGVVAGVAMAAILAGTAVATTEASAQRGGCIVKAGEGTGGNRDSAMFQAYEAILQATDWGMWMSWMASSQKVGQAPGYRVKIQRTNCKAGGLGQTCVVQAQLCKSS